MSAECSTVQVKRTRLAAPIFARWPHRGVAFVMAWLSRRLFLAQGNSLKLCRIACARLGSIIRKVTPQNKLPASTTT